MPIHKFSYGTWLPAHHRLNDNDRIAIAHHISHLPDAPSFLLVPLARADDPRDLWQPTLDAARQSVYPNWKIAVPEIWAPVDLEDGQCNWQPGPGIEPAGCRSAFFNAVCAGPDIGGDFVIPLPPGAILDERALYEFACSIVKEPEGQVFFGDQDQISGLTREYHSPRFKTAFDPDLMFGRDALGLPVAYRQDLLGQFPDLLTGIAYSSVALHDLALKAMTVTPSGQFVHVPGILCHLLDKAGAQPDWDPATARAIIQGYAEREAGAAVKVEPAPLAPAWCRVTRELPSDPPLVSIIIPTRDSLTYLDNCVRGILDKTGYQNVEILIVDNGTTNKAAVVLLRRLAADPRVRIISHPGPFNYPALNNEAARQARGEILLLLNNDTEVMHADWLDEMVSQALRMGVGAVGAKLHYADGRIQHAGVLLGRGDMLTHQLRLSAASDPGPQGELALTRTVLAVTGACLATRRSVFLDVGGLDEGLTVAFNDIDYCLRLNDHGYRVVWTPFAALYHLESVSRGAEDTPEKIARLARELAVMNGRWHEDLMRDPFHNPNLDFGWTETHLSLRPPQKSWVV
ncbi:glycosyltransferase family 2 protein [Acidisoma cellulosilytica]|uniref:Glycosyltransferase family 2 protein n=1 Tax=Acidisoma cellulosilyticum TaxID=2802395 RepID=A0A963Z0W8_9PROT|nr:glycosyltransferase family 2 protein [Acidisoma cellulosilyticum]MCB8880669.1 glycosyltransferase family 2 protein [Acidisoma cellulosilyticum]